MRASHALRLALAGLACGLAAIVAAAEPCRVAYDLGSSGIRAGAQGSAAVVRADLDFLKLLGAGQGIAEAAEPTIAALGVLAVQGGFDPACRHVGGGFSAWRLALRDTPARLAAALGRIHAASGVAVLVIPQAQEGTYGYFGSRQALGERLATTHVLDIGGGSLQISGERSSYGAELGQKVWHQAVCREIRRSSSLPCALQPLSADELAAARRLSAERLRDIRAALPDGITLTAISRPVSRGVLPAVARLAGGEADTGGFGLAALSRTIERLAAAPLDETTALTGNTTHHVAYLLSDMLLVEGVMQATESIYLRVAEIELTNVPGLLADDRAFAWGARYGCYLERLRALGIDAYRSDPADCN